MNDGVRGLLLGSFNDRNKYRGELVALGAQRLKLVGRDDLRVDEQFEPIGSFFDFAQAIAALGDKLGFAPSAVCFAIARAN